MPLKAVLRLALAPIVCLEGKNERRGLVPKSTMRKWLKEAASCGLRMLISAGKVILRVCHAVAQTVVAVGIAGWAGFGPGNLATLAGQATSATFSQAQLTGVGMAVAGLVHVTLPGAAAVALATTIVSICYAALFVLAFWLLMRLLKSLLQGLLEALDDLKEVAELAEQFA
jgi:hypothetical protein